MVECKGLRWIIRIETSTLYKLYIFYIIYKYLINVRHLDFPFRLPEKFSHGLIGKQNLLTEFYQLV